MSNLALNRSPGVVGQHCPVRCRCRFSFFICLFWIRFFKIIIIWFHYIIVCHVMCWSAKDIISVVTVGSCDIKMKCTGQSVREILQKWLFLHSFDLSKCFSPAEVFRISSALAKRKMNHPLNFTWIYCYYFFIWQDFITGSVVHVIFAL